jgi:DUF971 family protein
MYPRELMNDREAGVLLIRWEDDAVQQLGNRFLREQCPCATCRAMRYQRNEPVIADDSLRVTEIIPVGAYGVQLIFSDGHMRGIFPWLLLRQLKDELSIEQ